MWRRALGGIATAACIGATVLAADTVRGVSDSEILIGTYTDLSGVTAAWGLNNTNAIRMAFDETNEKGGINGRKIKYLVEDSQYSVPRSIQATNKLINRDGVFLMIANGGTPMNNATLPEEIEKGVPNMFPLAFARSMYEPFQRLKFGLFASYYDQMRAGVKYFVEQRGKKTLCAMYQDTDFGREVMSGVWDQAKAMGLKLAAETTHRPLETDFSAAVLKLRDINCDLVLLGTITRDTNQIIATMHKAGLRPDMLGSSASTDEAVATAPDGANEGYFAMTPSLYVYPDDPRPAVQAFMKSYKERFGRDPNYAAELGYTAAQLVLLGFQNAGRDLTVDSFIQGMESIKDYEDIFGSPRISFGPNRRHGTTSSYLVVVHNGRWEAVFKQPLEY
jgi:branched-chain amino acid transport system substrate-binding protein